MARYRCTNRYLKINGKRKPVCEWAEEVGLHRNVIEDRIRHGWSARAAVFTPKRRYGLGQPKARFAAIEREMIVLAKRLTALQRELRATRKAAVK